MKKIRISSKLSFIVSSITSMIFVGYFGYKGFMVYFVQKAMDDTFIGGSSSDITVTLWFAISGAMALSMLLFFQFTKIRDLKSQSTILKGVFIGWAGICAALIARMIRSLRRPQMYSRADSPCTSLASRYPSSPVLR